MIRRGNPLWLPQSLVVAPNGYFIYLELPKQAFEQGWIEDEETFAEMIQNRNLTTHTYNEDLAQEIYTNLGNYLSPFEFLLTKLPAQ